MNEPTITSRNPYRPDRMRARLAIGIALSVLVHALILSLQFGIPGLALPGLELPWNKRRAQAPELSIQIADVAPPPANEPAAADLPSLPTSSPEGFTLVAPVKPPELVPAPPPAKPKAAAPAKKAGRPKQPLPLPLAEEPATSPPRLIARTGGDDSFVVAAPSPEDPEKPVATDAAKSMPLPQTAEPPAAVIADASASTPAEELAQQKQVEESRAAEEAKQQALIAAQKQEELKQAQRTQEMIALAARQQADATRQADISKAEELARRQAAALALQQQQEALQQQARQQAEADKARDLLNAQQAREEIVKAQQLESQRREEQKRQEQLREQAMQLAQQQERELQQRQTVELEKRKQAEEQVRRQAMAQARQQEMEELAARQKADDLARRQAETLASNNAAQQRQRELASQAGAAAGKSVNAGTMGNANDKAAQGFTLPKSLLGSDLASRALDQAKKFDLLRGNPPVKREEPGKGRRLSIVGSIKEDVPLRMYVDSLRQKIERNGNLNYSQIAKDKARGDPVVTVVIRSDGSVEEIVFNRSSGRVDIDEAVRRIIRVNARYSAFPPNIAERYDVIEIRRIWNFDETLRILEEMP